MSALSSSALWLLFENSRNVKHPEFQVILNGSFLVGGLNPAGAIYYLQVILQMGQKKQHKKIPKKLPDFTLEDILNAPKPKTVTKRIDGTGCLHCGSTRIKAKGEVKVFRGKRMQPYFCFDCKQTCYKDE